MSAASCAIATPHSLATDAGADVFSEGGNAVDAAVAAATVLTVVYPHMCAVGGDVWALVVDPDGKASVVNGAGASAAAASLDQLRADHTSMPVTGPLTITVPGVVRGWSALLELGGTLDRAKLLQRAIHHARQGVPVAPSLAGAIEEEAELIEADAGMRSLFAPGGRPLGAGDLLAQPNLARSLEQIALEGDGTVYGGELGRTLADGLAAVGSPLTLEDFAAHRGRVVEPLSLDFDGFEVLTSPPPSQGVILLEILAALSLLGRQGEADPASIARLFHLTAKDRDRFIADPDTFDVPVGPLLSDEHIGELAAESEAGASPSRREDPRAPRAGGDTVAVTATDSEGWSVSLIQSVFHSFGSGVLDRETGVLFHNRGAAFSLDPASPNCFGPGKRPMHTLMPVIARSQDALAAIGTMGGLGQPQILAQIMLHIRSGASASRAVGSPRFTVGGLDVDSERDSIFVERAIDGAQLAALRESEFEIQELDELSELVGHSQASILRKGIGEAAADPRSDGSSAVIRRTKERVGEDV